MDEYCTGCGRTAAAHGDDDCCVGYELVEHMLSADMGECAFCGRKFPGFTADSDPPRWYPLDELGWIVHHETHNYRGAGRRESDPTYKQEMRDAGRGAMLRD